MASKTQTAQASQKGIWAGRILSALSVLFLLFDGVTKVMKVGPVADAFAQLGIPESMAPGIGILLLVCTAVYAIPQTAVLGAILLTGYLGGATAVQVRIGAQWFSVLFLCIIGVLVWGGLFLRDNRLRAIVPLRR